MTDPASALIRTRSSWRSYTGQPLDDDERAALHQAIDRAPTPPFGNSVRLALIQGLDAQGKRLGTYGMIRGAQDYLVGAVTRGERDLEDHGFVFEWLVLQATALGLGTCWLGGTLDRAAFGRSVQLAEDEWVPAVSPVGQTQPRRGLMDAGVRLFAGSRNRKPWSQLFFQRSFQAPLAEADAGPWGAVFEGVRIAPSASNKQPWRLLLDDVGVHLYLQPTPGYGAMLGFDIQRVDLGIAMCHLQLGADELGLNGSWQLAAPTVEPPKAARYLASWVLD